jgi:IS1 family transposase
VGKFLLSREKRLQVLAALVDGNSERAVERMTGVNRETISKYALLFGTGAQHLHNAQARDLDLDYFEVDEIWSYVGKKQARVTDVEHAAGLGDAYTYVALNRESRYVATWLVGKRDEGATMAFVADLRARLAVVPAMTTDGFQHYVQAVGAAFGPSIDYAQTVKNYTKSGRRDDDHRYEPPREPFITKWTVFGAPNLDRANTAHVERNNGTMRHIIGRKRRLCYAFSKSLVHHRAAVALGYLYYNLCHVVRTLRVTPAVAAGVTDHVWELEELLDALLTAQPCDAPTAKPLAPRKPEGTIRELPNGRGFLRVVGGVGGGKGNPPAPAPSPPAAPAAALPPAGAASTSAAPAASGQASAGAAGAPGAATPEVDPRQLDLFGWKPRRLPEGQLSLFGIEFDTQEKET